MVVSVLLALGAAALYGVASAVQQRSASEVSTEQAGPLRLVVHLIRDRRWLGGKVADLGAFGLQAVALAHGTLILVQAVLSFGLVFALVIGSRLAHRRLTAGEWGGAAVLGLGLTLLLGVGRPGGGRAQAPAPAWIVAAGIALVVVVGALVMARAHHRPRAGVVLAIGTGVAFALDGALLKSASDAVRDHGLITVTAIVAFAGFVAAAAIGNVLIHRAYQIASLVTSLPALTATEPIAGIAFGFLLYQEHLRGGLGAGVAELAGVVLMAAGCVWAALAADALPVHPDLATVTRHT